MMPQMTLAMNYTTIFFSTQVNISYNVFYSFYLLSYYAQSIDLCSLCLVVSVDIFQALNKHTLRNAADSLLGYVFSFFRSFGFYVFLYFQHWDSLPIKIIKMLFFLAYYIDAFLMYWHCYIFLCKFVGGNTLQ